MSRIILITFRDKDIFGGTLMVSHGIDEDTMQHIVLPCEPVNYYVSVCGAKLDMGSNEYYIPDKES